VAEQAKAITIAGEAAKVDETKSKTALNIAKAQEAAASNDPREKQQEMVMKQQEHGMKMQESVMKVQSAQKLAQIKASTEFSKLQSNQAMQQQDIQLNAMKGQQDLRHNELKGHQALVQGEQKHQMMLKQAAQKPKPAGGAGGR
jgi:hypothetical protein